MPDLPVDPQYARYSNRELEAFLTNPSLSEAQKSQVRRELTRRMRDDLLKSTQEVTKAQQQQRRQRAWKIGRLSVILIILVICLLSALCLVVVFRPEWLSGIFGRSTLFTWAWIAPNFYLL